MKFISFLVSSFMFFNSHFGFLFPVTKPQSDEGFKPSVRFIVMSDTHIGEPENDGAKIGRIPSAFKFAYNFAAENEQYKKLDAAMFVGDLTDSGTPTQFASWESEVKKEKKDETTILAIAANNHDGYIGKSCLDSLTAITGKNSDFHEVINGFHFIGLSTSKNEDDHYTNYQKKWLREQLKVAAAEDPEKPIFVCQHEHLSSTVYGSSLYESWSNDYFKSIVEDYPQVVHFSGHSHYPLNDPRSVTQGKITTIGTGSMAYMELTIGLDRSLHPDHCSEVAQAWIVESDGKAIRLTGFDAIGGDILCQYFMPSVTDRSTFAYTKLNSLLLSSAPKFEENAEMELTENSDGTYTATVPKAQSTDGKIILLYRINVYNNAGKVKYTDYVVNNYWMKETYDSVSFTFNAQPGYKVSITAENAYTMQSNSLTATIK